MDSRCSTRTKSNPSSPFSLLVPREMTPAQVGFCPLLLLLLLGLWLSLSTVSAKPKNMTSAKWFETQHVQPHPQPCSSAMPQVNYYKRHCKNLNTFLHQSLSSVIPTCDTCNRTCKNGHGNCHKSPEPVPMTMCQLVSGLYPNCKYTEEHLTKSYIVACDPPRQGDPQQYKLVPVHLDRVL
ncbi:ribonuclease 8-like isoform X1 [Ochotona curzoniae]|uniref:ribonuclease 8-like isoform X1 n=2 Tax=Ochotona curzoniae TaxID=130825 RepID=UPI001B3521D6|nr:ribonuclease 8-like isoform X1 [Ochotona curzoniae]